MNESLLWLASQNATLRFFVRDRIRYGRVTFYGDQGGRTSVCMPVEMNSDTPEQIDDNIRALIRTAKKAEEEISRCPF